MKSETRLLVQESWAAVLECAPAAAGAFYGRLIEIDPQLGGSLTGTGVDQQGRILLGSITEIVRGVCEAPDAVPPESPSASDPSESARQLMVAGAFISMLHSVLGPRFEPPLRAAWMEVFSTHAAAIHEAALGQGGTSPAAPPEPPPGPAEIGG